MLAILASHREIWSQLITNPDLQNVMRPTMSSDEEVTEIEYHFFLQVINHTATAFHLAQMGGISPAEGMRRDAYESMNWPVFKAAWDKNKVYQDANFVKFMDSCMAGIDLDKPVGRRPNIIQGITKKAWLVFLTSLPKRHHVKETIENSGEKQPTIDASNKGMP